MYLHYKLRIIFYKDDYPIKTQKYELVWWVVYNILTVIPLTIYAVYNIDCIDFKEYIFKIMIGFRVSKHYKSCSYFIYIKEYKDDEIEDSENTDSWLSKLRSNNSLLEELDKNDTLLERYLKQDHQYLVNTMSVMSYVSSNNSQKQTADSVIESQ